MIFLFHYIFLYAVYTLKQQRRKKIIASKTADDSFVFVENEVNKHANAFRDAELNIKFDPPVYKLRYEAVQKVILDERWKDNIHKVVDFGCAEFGLFFFLKRLDNLRDILMVDLDEEVLKANMYRLRPLNADYIKKRADSLVISILMGSISNPDPVLKNTDMVIAIEMSVIFF